MKVQNLQTVRYIVQLDSSCLYHSDDENCIPISHVCSYLNEVRADDVENEEKVNQENEKNKEGLEILKCLLQKGISHDPSHPSMGGLFSETETGELVFHRLIKRYGEKNIWATIERALAPFEDIPILQQIIRHAPEYCSLVLNTFPDSVLVCDYDGRFPVHVALESGMKWSLELLAIVNANRSHMKLLDPLTGWPLFLLAGAETSCDLRTIYFLLGKNPELVEKIVCYDSASCPEEDCDTNSENVEIVCDDTSESPLQTIADSNTIFIKSKLQPEQPIIAKTSNVTTNYCKDMFGVV